jgi:hypothetical protein
LLRFEQPVERALVHRASTAEVFPTDFRHLDDDVFQIGLQWPRAHRFYRLQPLDSALVVESIRQLTILTAHLGCGVPLSRKFVMTKLGFEIIGDPRVRPGSPLELTATARITDKQLARNGDVRRLRIDLTLNHDDYALARGCSDAVLLTERQYARMRGLHYGAEPLPFRSFEEPVPARVGRVFPGDVTVYVGDRGLEVIADPLNGALYDHLVDHVPGAALIEACLQAVRLSTDSSATDFHTFHANFHSMVEFASPNSLSMWTDDQYRFVISQDDRTCVEAAGTVRS